MTRVEGEAPRTEDRVGGRTDAPRRVASLRTRFVVLGLVVVLGVVASIAYFRYARDAVDTAAPGTAAVDLPSVVAGPHVVFRNTALGSDYGMVAAVALGNPGGPRAATQTSCERVYATATVAVCAHADRGVVQTYALQTLDASLRSVRSEPLTGLPSRVRISADGSLVATTTFVTGHSYAQTSFSTSTIIRRGGTSLGDLETWTTTLPDGQRLTAADRNYWGVTFARDDDTFYATVASGRTTWLVRGSLRAKTMQALRTDAECPSLSPDETRVAYKKRLGNAKPGVWRLAVLDLVSGRETLSAETRSVDDQQEWLDDAHVLYGLPREGTEATTSDVWSAAADGTGSPSVLIPGADSPAVVRP